MFLFALRMVTISMYDERGIFRSQGEPASSINFGPFKDVGMASSYARAMRNVGLIPLEAQEARSAFMQSGYSSKTIIARIAIRDFVKANTLQGPWPLLYALQQMHNPATSDGDVAFISQPTSRARPNHIGIDSLISMVKAVIHTTIGEDVQATSQFAQYQFDSFAAIEVSNSLGRSLGKDLPGTLMYDYPSIEEVAKFLYELLSKEVPNQITKGSQGLVATFDRDSLMGISKRSIKLKIGARLPGKPGTYATFAADNVDIVPYTRQASLARHKWPNQLL